MRTPCLPRLVAVGLFMALGTAVLFQPAPVQAQTAVSAASPLVVSGVRPEAFSWWWDNQDEALLKAANSEVQSFRWLTPPSSPQHLGYSAGARHEVTAQFGGALHRVVSTYLPPALMQGRVASDNFLGSKPYSFLAAQVAIDGRAPFTLLVQYLPTGSGFGDTQLRIDVSDAPEPALARAYADHLARTLKGLQPSLTNALNERYFNAVLKTRGFYTVGPVDKHLNVTLTIVQEIKGITPEMLAWWWDHIGDTSRYRLWQPIDHVTFEWTVEPTHPDLMYDVGATQKVKEYVGKSAWTLTIVGADPQAKTPPVPIVDPDYFYASTNLTLLKGILPDNSLVHQWRPNATRDGVVLTSTFVNTALATVLNRTFFQDLGSHCLREFQMLPYFLPRLYRREQLGQ
jgi:hypothetical protein